MQVIQGWSFVVSYQQLLRIHAYDTFTTLNYKVKIQAC
jgi:hypothetical protein